MVRWCFDIAGWQYCCGFVLFLDVQRMLEKEGNHGMMILFFLLFCFF
jgi:hypothetical protein